MEITKEDVKHVAHLSKLAFDETETAEFAGSLTKIVDMFLKLEEVDTTGVPFTSNVADNINTWREDVAVSGWNTDELFKNVPETEDGFIKVPTIIQEGTGKSGSFGMWNHPRGHVWNVFVRPAS